MRHPPALLSPKLELLDRTGRQLREEPFQALQGIQGPQYPDERGELGASAGFDAVSLDPLSQDLGDGCIGELGNILIDRRI